MSTHRTQRSASNAQVEIDEKPYRQHMERPLVEVTVWESIEDSHTILFEETDPSLRQLEPAGALLGRVPTAAVTALEDAGYTVDA